MSVPMRLARMSAFGYKQTYNGQLAKVRFTPESRHWAAALMGGPLANFLDRSIFLLVFFQIEPGPGDATPIFWKIGKSLAPA